MKHPRWLALSAGCALFGYPSILPAASWLNSPSPQLSIRSTLGGEAQVVVLGTDGISYRLEFTSDLRSWYRSPAQTASGDDGIIFPIAQRSKARFFRASAVGWTDSHGMSAEVSLGRRLFLETRFAQYFYAHAGDRINAPLSNGGDPTLDQTITLNGSVDGPFLGQSMNCRACHLGDEMTASGLGTRTLSDFGIRSAIPDRSDLRRLTVRNSPALVNVSVDDREPLLFHFDGEFPSIPLLVKGTFTGRNFGWLPEERSAAIGHIARVIRQDDGRAFLGPEWGGSYRVLLKGVSPEIPSPLRLPTALQLDVDTASDEQILDRVSELVALYVRSLKFSRNEVGEYDGSPYDAFLVKNSLPRKPRGGESDLSYSRRLRGLLAKLDNPVYVTPADGRFTTLSQSYRFGAEELSGLKIFLEEPASDPTVGQVSVGNCLACHPAPHFTDFSFHNSGATQWEYDAIHGEGAFAKLSIPGAAERSAHPDDYLPPSASRPKARGRFLAIPSAARPSDVDLGLWNVYLNDSLPAAQGPLRTLLENRFGSIDPEETLPRTVALFKTSGLRALGSSAPYMHTGQASTLESVIFFYRFTGELGRAQQLRNGDAEISRVFLGRFDTAPLAAFLRSLNEDFSR